MLIIPGLFRLTLFSEYFPESQPTELFSLSLSLFDFLSVNAKNSWNIMI